MLTVDFVVAGGGIVDRVTLPGEKISDAIGLADWKLKNSLIARDMQPQPDIIGYVVRDADGAVLHDSREAI
jgi:hypothetical protein